MRPLKFEQPLCLREALLLWLGLASLLAAECLGLSSWIDGVHLLAYLGSAGELAPLWLRYAAALVLPGALGWLLGRWLEPRLGRLAPAALSLVGCLLPVLNGLAATRPALLPTLSPAAAAALAAGALALLLAWLVVAGNPARAWAGRLTVAGLVLAPALLTPLNLLAWLRPAFFRGGAGLAAAVGLCGLAALWTAPLLAGLWGGPARLRSRRLLGALGGYAAAILLLVYALPSTRDLPGAGSAALASARPPILLIVVDTLRADAVSGFGPAPGATPQLRRLAEDATIFTRAFATAPWTTPSLASILTSTYPSEHRAGSQDDELGFKQALADGVAGLPELLAERGYWTGAVLTNGYLGRRFGLDRGFRSYENLLAIEWGHPLLIGLAARGFFEVQPFMRAAAQSERIAEAIRRGARSGQPFFVLAHYMDPHLPHRSQLPEQAAAGGESCASGDVTGYREEVAYADRHIGALLGLLEAMGLYDEMLIVLTADHGEELTEQRDAGPYGHGHTLFNEVLHVPLIVKRPAGEGAGEVRDEAVSLIDVAPTILQLAGVAAPPHFRGTPLLGLAEDSEHPRVVFSERILYGVERKAAIQGERKVVLDLASPSSRSARAYDLARDPDEAHPLDPERPRFRDLYAELLAFADRDREGGRAAHVELDPRLRQRLESLGYTE